MESNLVNQFLLIEQNLEEAYYCVGPDGSVEIKMEVKDVMRNSMSLLGVIRKLKGMGAVEVKEMCGLIIKSVKVFSGAHLGRLMEIAGELE
jgi:hypothetical protein